jgi:hypothetical protein
MSVRRHVLVLCLLVLPLALTASAPGAPKPKPGGTPTAPSNLRITASTDTSATLAWNAGNGGGASIWWYCVRRDGLGCIRVDPPTTTIVRTPLLPGTTFNWSVDIVTSAGRRSAPTNTVSYTTPADTTPPTVPTLSVTGTWPTRVGLSWTRSTDNTSQVWYTLLADGSPYTSNHIGLQSLLVFDLAPASTHTYQVTARDAYGNTSASNVVTVTTPPKTDDVPPSTPTNLRLSSETSAPEIWLDWDVSSDDTDPQAQILYDVYVNGVPEHAALGYGDTIVYCRDTGPNTLTVRAIDSSGNASGHSNQIVFVC